MKRFFDRFWVGFSIGLIGPFFGFFLYFLLVYLPEMPHKTLIDYWNMCVYNTAVRAPILSVSLIVNLGSFFLLLRLNNNAGAKGVLYGTFAYVPVILYLKYFQ